MILCLRLFWTVQQVCVSGVAFIQYYNKAFAGRQCHVILLQVKYTSIFKLFSSCCFSFMFYLLYFHPFFRCFMSSARCVFPATFPTTYNSAFVYLLVVICLTLSFHLLRPVGVNLCPELSDWIRESYLLPKGWFYFIFSGLLSIVRV